MRQKFPVIPFIHSTFRDANREVLLPKGLQWSLSGTSHLRFVLPSSGTDVDPKDLNSPAFHHGLIQSYNRWAFAKDLKFKTMEDINSVLKDGDHHFDVLWKGDVRAPVEKTVRFEDIAELLKDDLDAPHTSQIANKDHDNAQYEVWIHGEYLGPLTSESVENILDAIPRTDNRLAYSKTSDRIRIERYYRGHLRKSQAWDHIWDNLVALEDPKIVDDQTLIGTATLRDWVMGGNLTSRLWVQDQGESILFLRPLHHDDPKTTDRRYLLSDDDKKLARVRQELARLRHLAGLQHPIDYLEQVEPMAVTPSQHENRMESIRTKLRSTRKKRRFFGI